MSDGFTLTFTEKSVGVRELVERSEEAGTLHGLLKDLAKWAKANMIEDSVFANIAIEFNDRDGSPHYYGTLTINRPVAP